jgi:hypothetical protein
VSPLAGVSSSHGPGSTARLATPVQLCPIRYGGSFRLAYNTPRASRKRSASGCRSSASMCWSALSSTSTTCSARTCCSISSPAANGAACVPLHRSGGLDSSCRAARRSRLSPSGQSLCKRQHRPNRKGVRRTYSDGARVSWRAASVRPKCQDFLDRIVDARNGFVARNQDIMLQALCRDAEPELMPASESGCEVSNGQGVCAAYRNVAPRGPRCRRRLSSARFNSSAMSSRPARTTPTSAGG